MEHRPRTKWLWALVAIPPIIAVATTVLAPQTTRVLAGGLAWAVIAGVTRRVSPWLAVGAAVLVVIPPPFFWPAMGVLVVVLFGPDIGVGVRHQGRPSPPHV